MKRKYFEEELARLKLDAAEFAKTYPDLAHQLRYDGVHAKDPYVERLLEGVAYLTGCIREQIDADLPEMTENFLQYFGRQRLLPRPSALIAQYQPAKSMVKPETIAPGSLVKTNPLGPDQLVCNLQTAWPVEVLPLTITSCLLRENAQGYMELNLEIKNHTHVLFKDLALDSLRFFLATERYDAHELLANILDEQCQLKLTWLSPTEETLTLKNQAHLRWTPAVKQSLFPIRHHEYARTYLLQDYLLNPEKFYFFDLYNLAQLKLPDECHGFRLSLVMPNMSMKKSRSDFLKLFATPLINLYPSNAEPIQIDHGRTNYRLSVDYAKPESVQIYDVCEATLTSKVDNVVETCQDMTQLQVQGAAYLLNWKRYKNQYPVPYIQLVNQSKWSVATLAFEVLACNGFLLERYGIRQLQLGSSSKENEKKPLQVNLLTMPSRCLLPSENKNYQWQVISELAQNYRSLVELDNLKKLLYSLDWTEDKHSSRLIEGIKSIEASQALEVYQGKLCDFDRLRIEFESKNYIGPGEMRIFSHLLFQFYKNSLPPTKLVAIDFISSLNGSQWQWQD